MPDFVWHWLGLAVAFGGLGSVLVVMRLNHAKGLRRCKRCRYDLADRPEPNEDAPVACPECGTQHTTLFELKRSRRRTARALALITFTALIGYAVWVVPRVQTEGASGFVPTMVLVLAAPIIDRNMTTTDMGNGWSTTTVNGPRLYQLYDLSGYRMNVPCHPTVGTLFDAWFALAGVDETSLAPHASTLTGDWRHAMLTTGSLLPWQLRRRIVRDAEDLIADIQFFKFQVSAEQWVDQMDTGHIAMPDGWTLTMTTGAARSSLHYTFKSNASGGTMPRFDDDSWHGLPLEFVLRDEHDTQLAGWTAKIVPAPTGFAASRLAEIQGNWRAGQVKLIAITDSIERVSVDQLSYQGH